MNIFQYLFYLGIIQVLYSFIFKWASLAFAFILVILKLEKWGAYILKTINYYLYISLLGLLTLTALNGDTSIPYLLLIIGTGLFFAFTSIGGGMYEGQKIAQANYDYMAIEMMKYDSYFLIASLAYFIFVLFVPTIANTLPVHLLFIIIDWVYKLPIIGFFVGIYGVYTVFGTLFQAFIMGGAVTYLFLNKLRGKKEEKDSSPR